MSQIGKRRQYKSTIQKGSLFSILSDIDRGGSALIEADSEKDMRSMISRITAKSRYPKEMRGRIFSGQLVLGVTNPLFEPLYILKVMRTD